MTVAMINSNAHSHLKKRGFYSEYSPCKNLFLNRFAVGIHHAEKEDLLRFQSNDGYHKYVRFPLKIGSLAFWPRCWCRGRVLAYGC